MIDYVETKCRSLTDAQRQQLAVTMEDIVFMLPEDVSVVFDQYGELQHVLHRGRLLLSRGLLQPELLGCQVGVYVMK